MANYNNDMGFLEVRNDQKRMEDWIDRALEIGLKAMIQGSGSVDLAFVNKAFEGWGTDEETVMRIIGGHDKATVNAIRDRYACAQSGSHGRRDKGIGGITGQKLSP